jgi:hypothetical protein
MSYIIKEGEDGYWVGGYHCLAQWYSGAMVLRCVGRGDIKAILGRVWTLLCRKQGLLRDSEQELRSRNLKMIGL